MSIITDAVQNNIADSRTGTDAMQASNATTQHVVICGMCGAVEKMIGPRKTECPNCDEYIY